MTKVLIFLNPLPKCKMKDFSLLQHIQIRFIVIQIITFLCCEFIKECHWILKHTVLSFENIVLFSSHFKKNAMYNFWYDNMFVCRFYLGFCVNHNKILPASTLELWAHSPAYHKAKRIILWPLRQNQVYQYCSTDILKSSLRFSFSHHDLDWILSDSITIEGDVFKLFFARNKSLS